MATVVPLSRNPNREQIAQHWDHLFGGYLDGVHDGLVELSWTGNGSKPQQSRHYGLEERDKFVDDSFDLNKKAPSSAYIGAALRKPDTPEQADVIKAKGRTKKINFYAATSVWVDIDNKGAAKKAPSRYRGCPPTFWVVTSNEPHLRVQLWWRLKEPIRDQEYLERILRGLKETFDGDKAVTNCANLMRLGGSINWSQKPDRIYELTHAQGPGEDDSRARDYHVEQIVRAFSSAPAFEDLDIGGNVTDVQACIDNIKRGHHLHVNSRDLIWQMVSDRVPTWVINTTMNALLTPVSDGGTIGQVPNLIDSARSKLEIPEPEREQTTPLALIDPRKWLEEPVPERQWLIEDYIPMNHVTALYGDGGLGKTLLAHQLLTSVATGKNWLGLPVNQMRGIGFFCEDFTEDLHISQDNINFDLGVGYSDLGDLRMVSRVGEDNILMTFINGNKGERTALYEQLLSAVRDFEAQFVVIDTLADVFDGNENVRVQARQFIANVCGRLAREIEGAVLVCAHPSVAGMKSGDGYGGSTAWSNSVRSRLYLSRPEEDDEQVDPDERVLSRKKANYAALGTDLPLIWSEGVLSPLTRTPRSKEIAPATQNQMLIKVHNAWGNERPYAEGANSPRYVGHMLVEAPFNLSKKRAKKLVGQWLIDGRVKSETVDARSKTRGLKVVEWFD